MTQAKTSTTKTPFPSTDELIKGLVHWQNAVSMLLITLSQHDRSDELLASQLLRLSDLSPYGLALIQRYLAGMIASNKSLPLPAPSAMPSVLEKYSSIESNRYYRKLLHGYRNPQSQSLSTKDS